MPDEKRTEELAKALIPIFGQAVTTKHFYEGITKNIAQAIANGELDEPLEAVGLVRDTEEMTTETWYKACPKCGYEEYAETTHQRKPTPSKETPEKEGTDE